MKIIHHYGILLLMACVRQAVVGFFPPRPMRAPSSLHTLSLETTDVTLQQPRRRRRVNTNVRNIMKLIESRYGEEEDWTKTKTYIYHASEKLSPQQVQEVVTFLDSLGSKEVSKHILQTMPRILRKPVQSFLQPTADFLLELWGPSLFEEAMNRNPHLLLSSGVGYTNDHRNNTSTVGDGDVEELLSELAGLSSRSLVNLKRTAPFVFGLPLTKVKSVLEYLSGLLQYGNIAPHRIPKVIGKLVASYPFLLNLYVETNLQPRIEFLSTTCGLNVTDVAKLVQSAGGGSVLGLSVDQNLKPKIDFLIVLLQHDRAALRKCILAHPQLLALSISNLQSKVNYFNSIGKSLATRIAFRSPAVYSLSLTGNLIPTIDFLAKVWGVTPAPTISNVEPDGTFGIEKNDDNSKTDCVSLAHFLQEYPNVLTLSLGGNIQTTMNFFNRTGYTLLNDDWELVEGQTRIRGRYIAASLYNRLLPRWHYCLSCGLKAPPSHILVGSSDPTFCQELGLHLKEFELFKDDAVPRLKFSSQFDTWLKTGRPIDV